MTAASGGPLSIPDIDYERAGMLVAALAYAAAGWYVLPVLLSAPKHAGAALGKGWPEKTSRDPQVIREWFTHPRAPQLGIALHVGRSGAQCFDVDHPDNLPEVLVTPLSRGVVSGPVVYQSTRIDEPDRGHYLFALPPGVQLGNGMGSLRTDPPWGDVRGTNGIIVVAPTPHQKAAQGGRYRWEYTGTLTPLPAVLLDALRPPPRRAPIDPRTCSPAYLENRIRGLLSKVMATQEGERNNVLYWAACRMGELVGQAALDEGTAMQLLAVTAEHIGLTGSEVTGSVMSGIRTGRGAG